MVCNKRLFLLFVFILAGRLVWGASETQEKALWTLWSLQTNTSTRPETIVAACQQMQSAPATNALLAVSQGLAAWHYLRLGKTNEAIAIFNAMVTAPAAPTISAGAEMGRRWLTRLDREQVRIALAAYYRKAVEYPINLQPLKKATKGSALPLTDRWDAPWQYQLTTFKVIKVARGQRYLLQSKTLGESSDLAKALERPYAGGIRLQPLALAITGSGAQNVVFQTPGDKPERIILSEGGQAEGVSLTYIGTLILVLCDGDHWRVVTKPVR